MRVCIDGKFEEGLPGQATAAAAADRDSFGERVHSTYTTGANTLNKTSQITACQGKFKRRHLGQAAAATSTH